jgi:uncharacterized membrane-anchored protein
MLTLPAKALLGLAAVAGLQTAAIGWMVTDRITLLKTGREVVLPIIPVDPRSLFRGDYVRIDFPVTMVSSELFAKNEKPRKSGAVYVTLQREGESWKPVAVSETAPKVTPPLGAEQTVLQGRLAYNWWPGSGRTPHQVRINYGIERYYVPEGTGLELEKAAREKKLAVVVAVDGKGRSAIKGLIIDGKLAYEEPLL